MENIIPAIDRALIKKELKRKLFRITNHGNREIYIVDNLNAPNILLEIGRLREISFRDSGGGTGKSVDLDEFDLSENPFQQLIVWDPKEEEIIGGYRFMKYSDCSSLKGKAIISPRRGFPNQ